jgi:LysM repeat protein
MMNYLKYTCFFLVTFWCFAFAKADSYSTSETFHGTEKFVSKGFFFQDYITHEVKDGETLKKIAALYDVQEKDIIALNPDVRRKFRKGITLIIPKKSLALTQKNLERFKIHKVKRKQTLYGLSKKYDVTVLDIKEANKRLYAEELGVGDEIRIPVFGKEVAIKDLSILSDSEDGYHTYVVQPSEGFFRIAENNGTSIETIKKLNPEVTELKPGMVLKVPDPVATLDGFVEYRIPSKTGMYSLKKLTGLSADSLLALNPELKDGFKAGMTVLIPSKRVDSLSLLSLEGDFANLVDSIQNYKAQRLALMLPFSLNAIDTINTDKDRLRSDKALRIALDFYSGAVIARDSARILGLKVDYDLFDTRGDKDAIKEILSQNRFEAYDAVVGPLRATNVDLVAQSLMSKDVPVVSPLTNSNLNLHRNLIQTRPTDQLLKSKLMAFLIEYTRGKNVILVTDNSNPSLRNEFSRYLPQARVIIPDLKTNYIYKKNYLDQLLPDQENVVVLAVDNMGFINDATNQYASAIDKFKITMVGLDDFEDMDLSTENLAKLNYIFPKMYKEDGDDNSFIRAYLRRYNIVPNKYATRGFDVVMDVILRNASADSFYESVIKDGRTVMAESKFDFVKSPSAGYFNEAIYILQFQNDLTFKELFSVNNKP